MNDTDPDTKRQAASDGLALATARLLWQHWQSGTTLEGLPAELRPATRAQGYAAQAKLPLAANQTVAGWKIAATSVAGQRHIGVSGPLAGRLLGGQIDDEAAAMSLRGNRMRVAEPEFAFRFGRPLAPRVRPYEVEEVMAAVAGLHPSIEVPDSRYADFARAGEAQLIADNACAWRFVLGPSAPSQWRQLDLAAHAVSARVTRADTSPRERTGSGTNVLGDPRLALAWLVNELSALGVELEAGAVVMTGTCMPPLEIVPGDAVLADFGVLGRVSVRFGT